MPSAPTSQRHLPAIYGRSDPVARSLFVAAGSALTGLLVGGVSVLSVLAAIGSPPGPDAAAGSMVFDGRSHVVVRAMTPVAAEATVAPAVPTSAPKPAVAPASNQSAPALQTQPAVPAEIQPAPQVEASQTAAPETVSPAPKPQREAKKVAKRNTERNRRRLQPDENVADNRQQNLRPLYDSYNDDRHYRHYDNWNNFGFQRRD